MKETKLLHSIKKVITGHLPLLFILLAGIVVRILFYLSIDGPILYSDSATYIGGARNLVKYLSLDEYRPPVYLIQLILCGVLFTWQHLQIGTVILQNIIGLLTILFLYSLVMEAFEDRMAAYIAAFFAAVSFSVYGWDFVILTENLSIFLLTGIAYYLIVYLKYSKASHLKILLAFLLVSIFTKPFFMVLPVLVALLLLLRNVAVSGFRSTIHLRPVALGLAVIYMSLAAYSGLNQIQHSFFGITTVGKVNTFGKILQYKMEGYGGNPVIVENVREAFSKSDPQYIVEGKFVEPWYFISAYGWNQNHYMEVGNFAREIILKKPMEYSIKSLKLTWNLLTVPPLRGGIAEGEVGKAGHPNHLMLIVKKFTEIFDSLYPLILVCGVEVLVLLAVNRKHLFTQNAFYLVCIFLLILYHYIISAFFSYGDYTRLLAPSYTLIYAVIAVYISRILQFYQTKSKSV